MGASETGAIAYARTGLKVIHLGDEAILLTKEFTLDGRDMRPVRQAVNRVERTGYTARVRRHNEIPDEEMRGIAALATDWRDTETERGFSMALGRLGDPADGRCVLVEAIDEHGKTKAMVSFSPWGARGLSLDLMRRDPQAENGAMEFMVSELMQAAPRLGVDRVSLNFAVFRAGLRGGRADRRRADPAAVAAHPAVLLPLVAARVALPVQRQVPATLDAALPVLRGAPRAGPGRPRLGHRRGVRGHPRHAPPRRWTRCRPRARRARSSRTSSRSSRTPSRRRPRAARNRCGYGWTSSPGSGRPAIDPYPVDYPRTDVCGEIHERWAGPRPGQPHR